MSLIDS